MSLETKEASSFRDPNSQVYIIGGRIVRAIMPAYVKDYQMLMRSGLYDELVSRGLMIQHEDLYGDAQRTIIRPEFVPFVSYPYEWCFSQLKKAALVTLDVNLAALEYGMILKDASAFNVQYANGWKLIDSASFEEYQDGQPWWAYGQFMRHFTIPLVLAHYRGARYIKLLQSYIDGLPVSIARELPFVSKVTPDCLLFVHSLRLTKRSYDGRLRKEYLVRLLGKLRAYISGLMCKVEGGWAEYGPDYEYTKRKAALVTAALAGATGRTLDIGANTGAYSRIAAQMGRDVVAIDSDHDCVEWITVKPGVLPLVVDLANPTPAIGWGNRERKSFLERASFDTVMALALIHHLCIGSNIPLGKVAETLRGMTKGTLLIEFVPETDEKARILAEGRVYPPYSEATFLTEFRKFFDLKAARDIGGSCRRLYIYSAK